MCLKSVSNSDIPGSDPEKRNNTFLVYGLSSIIFMGILLVVIGIVHRKHEENEVALIAVSADFIHGVHGERESPAMGLALLDYEARRGADKHLVVLAKSRAATLRATMSVDDQSTSTDLLAIIGRIGVWEVIRDVELRAAFGFGVGAESPDTNLPVDTGVRQGLPRD